jgi:hypothetical protein
MKRFSILTTLVVFYAMIPLLTLYGMVRTPAMPQAVHAVSARACEDCLIIPVPAAKAMRDLAATMTRSTDEAKTSAIALMKSMEGLTASLAATTAKAVEDAKTSVFGQ